MDQAPRMLAEDFRRIAEVAGVTLAERDLVVQSLPSPHRPPSALPLGWMAVHVFFYGDAAIKIGRAGPDGSAQYVQDYSAAGSSGALAAKLVDGSEGLGLAGLTRETVADWICDNTTRLNFLIRAKFDVRVLALLEAFLACRLQPDITGLLPRPAPARESRRSAGSRCPD